MKLFLACIFLIGISLVIPQQIFADTSGAIVDYFPTSDSNIFNNNSWNVSISDGTDPFYGMSATQAQTRFYTSHNLDLPTTSIHIGQFPNSNSAHSALDQVMNQHVHQGFRMSVYNSQNNFADCSEAISPSSIDYLDYIGCTHENFVVVVYVSGNQYQTPPLAKAFIGYILNTISSSTTPPISNTSSSNTSPPQSVPQTSLPTQIPSWVKNNADYWSVGNISDDDFIKGIQYMIQQKIITIPSTIQGTSSQNSIPSWVRNDAKLWSGGEISDDDFVKAIQYLIITGIIRVQ